jgi:hypothetical protein
VKKAYLAPGEHPPDCRDQNGLGVEFGEWIGLTKQLRIENGAKAVIEHLYRFLHRVGNRLHDFSRVNKVAAASR